MPASPRLLVCDDSPLLRRVLADMLTEGGMSIVGEARDGVELIEKATALAPDVINVIAYYRLMRGDSTTARGPTSLVMRRLGGAWKIIHDHSS